MAKMPMFLGKESKKEEKAEKMLKARKGGKAAYAKGEMAEKKKATKPKKK